MEQITWENTAKVLEEYAEFIVKTYRENLAHEGTNASKKLSDTLKSKVVVGQSVISVELRLQDYWYYVERGRKAGKFPPIDKLMEWIKVKPIIAQPMKNGKVPKPKQLAYLIGRKIARKGTKGTQALERASERTYQSFQYALEQAIALDIEEGVVNIIRGVF